MENKQFTTEEKLRNKISELGAVAPTTWGQTKMIDVQNIVSDVNELATEFLAQDYYQESVLSDVFGWIEVKDTLLRFKKYKNSKWREGSDLGTDPAVKPMIEFNTNDREDFVIELKDAISFGIYYTPWDLENDPQLLINDLRNLNVIRKQKRLRFALETAMRDGSTHLNPIYNSSGQLDIPTFVDKIVNVATGYGTISSKNMGTKLMFCNSNIFLQIKMKIGESSDASIASDKNINEMTSAGYSFMKNAVYYSGVYFVRIEETMTWMNTDGTSKRIKYMNDAVNGIMINFGGEGMKCIYNNHTALRVGGSSIDNTVGDRTYARFAEGIGAEVIEPKQVCTFTEATPIVDIWKTEIIAPLAINTLGDVTLNKKEDKTTTNKKEDKTTTNKKEDTK